MNYEKSKGPHADRPLMRVGLPTTKLTSEEEQVLIKDGSEEALNKLILHTMSEACAYGQKVCQGNVDGEDIFSACYDALVQSAKNFKPGLRSFFTYSRTYIRGQVFKAWKNQRAVPKAQMVKMTGTSDDDALFDEVGEFDFADLNRRELLELIKPIIEKHLSEKERLAVELHDAGEMSFESIGKVLGCCRSRVQQLYEGAVKKIRLQLVKINAI